MSASAVKKFAKCPKQYWYRYIRGYEVFDEGNRFTDFGSAIHDSIEAVLKEADDLSDEEALLEMLREENRKHEEYPQKMESDAQKCLEVAASFISDNIPVDSIREIEERREMEREDVRFTGYIDLATDDAIYDWKTGKSEGKEFDEQLQAAVYLELYYDQYGEYPEHVHFVYVKEGILSSYHRVDDGEVKWNEITNKLFETVIDYVRRIKKADALNEWEAKPDDSNCYWCDFKYHCADGLVGAENVEPVHIEIEL